VYYTVVIVSILGLYAYINHRKYEPKAE